MVGFCITNLSQVVVGFVRIVVVPRNNQQLSFQPFTLTELAHFHANLVFWVGDIMQRLVQYLSDLKIMLNSSLVILKTFTLWHFPPNSLNANDRIQFSVLFTYSVEPRICTVWSYMRSGLPWQVYQTSLFIMVSARCSFWWVTGLSWRIALCENPASECPLLLSSQYVLLLS